MNCFDPEQNFGPLEVGQDTNDLNNPLDAYTNYSDEYAAFAEGSYTWQYIEQPALDRYISEYYTQDIRVLDLGSGNGRVIKHLVEQGLSAVKIIGIEPVEELVKIAKQDLPESEFVVGNATNIPLKNESVELVTANMLIHHLDKYDLQDMFHEVYRVLTPDGVFMLVGVNQAHSQDAVKYHEDWMVQQTPWGAKMKVYNHDINNMLLDNAYYAGLDMWYGRALEPTGDGASNPTQYTKHTSHYARFAARFHKVPQDEKQRRIDYFDQDLEHNVHLDPKIKQHFSALP